MKELRKVQWKKGKRIGDESGFGEVYEAKMFINGEEQAGDYVLKKLVQLDDDSIGRFKREVRYLTKLDHPIIVKAVGYNLQEEPYFYSMMKYQSSLKNVIPQLSTDYSRLLLVFNNILDGLEYLHNEGYYHRDLKPANVLYNSDSDLVLCDLGLCVNSNSDDSSRLTITHMGAGTKYYCSPEQETDLRSVDQRTDIYSIGKMIYEAFTGCKPPVLDFNQLPAAIQYVVKKSTKENRDDRYETISVLRQHFNNAMELLINGSSQDDLLTVINEINRLDTLDIVFVDHNHIVDKLAHLLSRISGDEQFQEILMSISGNSFNVLEFKYPDLVKSLMFEFIQSINSQRWPFTYTDTLANKYEEIFINIKDTDIKGDILKGVLSLGVGHNRWYVMYKFITMLAEIKDDPEAHSIYHILSSESYELKRIYETISIEIDSLHPVIRRLFVF